MSVSSSQISGVRNIPVSSNLIRKVHHAITLSSNVNRGSCQISLDEPYRVVKYFDDKPEEIFKNVENFSMYIVAKSMTQNFIGVQDAIDRFIQENPDDDFGYLTKTCVALRVSDTKTLEDSLPEFSKRIMNGNAEIEHLFTTMLLGMKQEDIEKIARSVSKKYPGKCEYIHQDRNNKKIRLGYLSPSFGEHPVSRLIIPVLKNHDREKFDVYLYTTKKPSSCLFGYDSVVMYRAFENADVVRYASDNESLSEKIADDQIDILIDLSGYTDNGFWDIWGEHPAPKVISFLGFLGTTGHFGIDYIISDSEMIHNNEFENFTETPIILPRCFIGVDGKQEIQSIDNPFPEGKFVWASVGMAHKNSPEAFDVWAEILNRCPDSIFWMRNSGEITNENITREFVKRGVNPERIIFKNFWKELFLSALGLVDVYLDTFSHSAGATCADALFSGCPVLSVPGKNMITRTASSILKEAGFENISNSSEYIEKAVSLYNNPKELKELKKKVSDAKNSRLFNVQDWTKCLESAYISVHNQKEKEPIFVECSECKTKTEKRPTIDSHFATYAEYENILGKVRSAFDEKEEEYFKKTTKHKPCEGTCGCN